ncbi:MAG: radical SAM family heme chaperone HemW [Caldithrix sp.]|nr:radical SAM family heme chaperone HemW [Caldithrix sp.]
MPFNRSHYCGLYIHIPFCEHKCEYCDFFSVTDNHHRQTFVSLLLQEMELTLQSTHIDGLFDTIYLGGGTPSLLTEHEVDILLQFILKHFRMDTNTEITMEINPGSLTDKKLASFRRLGVNRLNVGVQSFVNNELKVLGRIHDADKAFRSVEAVRNRSFDNIGLDLIYGVPGQTQESWQYSLSEAIRLQPEHISAYNLTIENGTPFYDRMLKGEIKPSGQRMETLFFKQTVDTLKQASYKPYEISNYARAPKFYSRHNQKYWYHIPYLGFGPSAHSFWNEKRWANKSSMSDYVFDIENGQRPLAFTESIDDETKEFEYIFLGLRTYDGINLQKFEETFGRAFKSKYGDLVDSLLLNQLADMDQSFFRLTQKGMMISDEITPKFL